MKQISRRHWRSVAEIAAAVGLLSAGPSAADILIVSSSAPALQSGMQIADSGKLEIPAGAKVRVLLPSGATLAISGPASRLVKEVTKGEPLTDSIWAKAKELLETGGVDQSRPGATRGTTPSPQSADFSWREISATANGTVCVEKGAPLFVVRAGDSPNSELTLIDTTANSRGTITWKDGETRAEWPASILPRTASLYQVMAKSQPMRQLRLKVIDKDDTRADRAFRTLIQNDCLQQVRAWARSEP